MKHELKTEVSNEEKQIVRLLLSGKKTEEIAKVVGIKPENIATKLREIRIKYGCKNSVELAGYFLREGIIN
jgi:DNA-binding CsgD family transcriptional regulator